MVSCLPFMAPTPSPSHSLDSTDCGGVGGGGGCHVPSHDAQEWPREAAAGSREYEGSTGLSPFFFLAVSRYRTLTSHSPSVSSSVKYGDKINLCATFYTRLR